MDIMQKHFVAIFVNCIFSLSCVEKAVVTLEGILVSQKVDRYSMPLTQKKN